MKKIKCLLFSSSLLSFLPFITLTAQITEPENTLRTSTIDTTRGWKHGGIVAITVSQTSLTNWAAGGQNSVSMNGVFSAFANYKTPQSAWDNTLDIGYGILQQGENKTWLKSDDKIDFMSKYGKKVYQNWYVAALVNAKTQFTEGYNYPNDSVIISDFFAPAYILGALGMDYKPNTYFSAFIAPLTAKFTIVDNQQLADAGAFGVEPAEYDTAGVLLKKGERQRSEFGGYVRMIFSKNDFKNEFLKNVSFISKIDLFSNYVEEPSNIDVNWETLIAFKINKFISANINTQLLYDHDTKIAIDKDEDGIPEKNARRTQFKEIFGLGFAYKF